MSRRPGTRILELVSCAGLVLMATHVVVAGASDEGHGPVPTEAQARFQALEFGLFFHFGINTAYGVQSSDGTLDAEAFAPTSFDADAWVRVAKESGARYVILTAKHRDGFCLWQTKTTRYSVRASSWKGGHGDLVAELAEACARGGIGFGFYLAAWDRHEPAFSDPAAYDEFFSRQLEELLTGYGEIVEVWLDDASPDGRAYDWDRPMELIRRHQPRAMVFNMGEPTVRWSGDDTGFAPEPCWNVAQRADIPGFSRGGTFSTGEGSVWLPVECNVPLAQDWYWSSKDTAQPKSMEELLVIYYRSVGRGANLLLGVAPDGQGVVPAAARGRLREFEAVLRDRFAATVAETRGVGDTIELEVDGESVDHVVLEEEIRSGERVRNYVVEAEEGRGWVAIAAGRSVGHKRIHWFEPVKPTRLRVRVLESRGESRFGRVAAYLANRGRAAELYDRAKQRLGSAEGRIAALKDLDMAIQLLPAFGPYHLLRGFLRKNQDDMVGALADLDLVLSLEPALASLHHVRAEVHFRLGHFAESISDYDIAVAHGRPHNEESCWERGLAHYYEGNFAAARKQFEGYHHVGPSDIENGLWRFLCVAEEKGIEQARATMFDYPERRRKPFPALLDLYLGRGEAQAVLVEALQGVSGDEERRKNVFYGNYYLGKYYEIVRDHGKAVEHVREALRHEVDHFMYFCARIDLTRLEQKVLRQGGKSVAK